MNNFTKRRVPDSNRRVIDISSDAFHLGLFFFIISFNYNADLIRAVFKMVGIFFASGLVRKWGEVHLGRRKLGVRETEIKGMTLRWSN